MTENTRKPLTPRQQEIFHFIQSCIAERYPPTIREIGQRFGFSEKAAHDHVTAIEKKGYIQRLANSPRSITIVDAGSMDAKTKSEPEELIIELTPEINIQAKGYRVGEFIHVRRQPYGLKGEVVLMNTPDSLTLYKLTGHVSNIFGKVVGHTIGIG